MRRCCRRALPAGVNVPTHLLVHERGLPPAEGDSARGVFLGPAGCLRHAVECGEQVDADESHERAPSWRPAAAPSTDCPPYPRHELVHAYVEKYEEHFGFRVTMTFTTTVVDVSQDSRGGWLVRTSGPDPPTLAPSIPDKSRSGEQLEGREVAFKDGIRAPADLLVWATGSKVMFPFLDPALVSASDDNLPLWKRTVHPDLPGLFFIGLPQPVGAVMPVAELTGKVVAITGGANGIGRETARHPLWWLAPPATSSPSPRRPRSSPPPGRQATRPASTACWDT